MQATPVVATPVATPVAAAPVAPVVPATPVVAAPPTLQELLVREKALLLELEILKG